jgi:hypothetical protein
MWAGHVARMDNEQCVQNFSWITLMEETTWEIQVQMG